MFIWTVWLLTNYIYELFKHLAGTLKYKPLMGWNLERENNIIRLQAAEKVSRQQQKHGKLPSMQHKLSKLLKTWKMTKKSSMHWKIMEFEKNLNNHHGKIMDFCEIIWQNHLLVVSSFISKCMHGLQACCCCCIPHLCSAGEDAAKRGSWRLCIK